MDIIQYFKGVLRWWWLILLSAALAAGASYYASSKQPKVYQTTATLMVGQVTQQANPTGQEFYLIEQLAASYAQIARRQPVLQATIDSLGLKMPWQALKNRVYVSAIPRTQLLAISVQDTSPERAVAIADEIAYQLILQSPTSPENVDRSERTEFVQEQLDSLESRIRSSTAQLKELEAELDTALSARQIQSLQTEIASLESLITTWQANYTELLNFLEGGASPNYLTVIEPAQLPYQPISPKVMVNVLLAAVVGFTLALGAALLLEYLDDTIKSTDDLNAALNLTTLGSIPYIMGKAYKDKLAVAHTPFSPIAEAYRLVRTNIQFMAVDGDARTIMVTSSNLSEGKSTTAANLAIVMAQAELKTILIDADLRRPSVHKVFQLPNAQGLTDLLRSPQYEIGDQLKRTEFENLQVITSGPLPPNPSEMLGSQRMADLLQQLQEIADVVIFDTPPVLAVSDAAVLANRVDGVIFVIKAKQTRRKEAQEAHKRLQQGNTTVLGSVLNQASGKEGGYYYTYYAQTGNAAENTVRSKLRRLWRRLPLVRG